jgi:hypothetical protein
LSTEFPYPVLLHDDLLKHRSTAFLEIIIQILPHLVQGISEIADLLGANLVDMPEIVVVCLKRGYLELHHLLLGFYGIYLFLELLFDTPDFCFGTVYFPVAFKEELVVAFKPNELNLHLLELGPVVKLEISEVFNRILDFPNTFQIRSEKINHHLPDAGISHKLREVFDLLFDWILSLVIYRVLNDIFDFWEV